MAQQVKRKLVVPAQFSGYELVLSRTKERQLELSLAHTIKPAIENCFQSLLPTISLSWTGMLLLESLAPPLDVDCWPCELALTNKMWPKSCSRSPGIQRSYNFHFCPLGIQLPGRKPGLDYWVMSVHLGRTRADQPPDSPDPATVPAKHNHLRDPSQHYWSKKLCILFLGSQEIILSFGVVCFTTTDNWNNPLTNGFVDLAKEIIQAGYQSVSGIWAEALFCFHAEVWENVENLEESLDSANTLQVRNGLRVQMKWQTRQ